MGDATIETELVDIVRNVSERAVGGLAYGGGLLSKCRRPCRRRVNSGYFPDQSPQPLYKPPGALHAFLVQNHVAIGGRSSMRHPARGVGSVGSESAAALRRVFL